MNNSITLESLPISVALLGDNVVIPKGSDSSQKILVVSMTFLCAAAVTVKFKHGAGDYSGTMAFAANTGLTLIPVADEALFVVPPGEDFIFTLGAALAVAGVIWFKRIPK